MKYLIICVSLALFAYINASPVYGNRGGYGGGYGGIQRVVYEEERPYGRGYNHYGPRELRSYGEEPRAAASAAAAASAVSKGNYRSYAIPSYVIDGGDVGHRGGHYGRGGY
ncbi:chorion protein S15 [Drosophila kikkawai]|uniref:Chorion protein S15 n=1 Tax=Drosophila kikkawai TaxID=30033 RepID=A0A6P4IV84_DROKI|nr:chorion protein S15 [Drosophila kikkawai]